MSPEELFNNHLHIAESTVYKLFGNPRSIAKKKGIELEDLFQYARESLWEAAMQFDQTKGKRSFQNFAITNIRWSLTERLRRDCKKFTFRGTGLNPREIESKTTFISFDSKPTIDEEEGSTYHELIGDEYNLEGEVIGSILGELAPERTKEILKLKMEGVTLSEIGKQYGISHEAVRMDIKRFANRLKKVI